LFFPESESFISLFFVAFSLFFDLLVLRSDELTPVVDFLDDWFVRTFLSVPELALALLVIPLFDRRVVPVPVTLVFVVRVDCGPDRLTWLLTNELSEYLLYSRGWDLANNASPSFLSSGCE
jgi:hypothetical protein